MNRPLSRSAYRGPAADSITLWIIVLCVGVFLFDRVLGQWFGVRVTRYGVYLPIEYWSFFSEMTAIENLELWRFISFQFIHANVDHLLFNMIALYFFGPLVEAYLSSRIFLLFYLLSGAGGAGMYLLLLMMGFGVGSPWAPLVGASAGIFGVLIAAARIAPDSVALVFGIIPMKLRTLAYLFIFYAIYAVLFSGNNAGGEAAHLGGAVVGYLLMEWPAALERIAWIGGRSPPF